VAPKKSRTRRAIVITSVSRQDRRLIKTDMLSSSFEGEKSPLRLNVASRAPTKSRRALICDNAVEVRIPDIPLNR
jgi:hypothetical protein